MFGTLRHFAVKYLWPQRNRIFCNLQLHTTLLIAALVVWNDEILSRAVSFQLVSQLVNYNFMAFGFTIAALTIVFAVPNSKFTEAMFRASQKNPEKGEGPWEDALFLMVWNGVVHFSALACTVGMLLFFDYGKDNHPSVIDPNVWPNPFWYMLLFWVQVYAIVQFLMTLLSTYFFCASYIRNARSEWRKSQGS